ncbi:MAG: TolC family protein [Ideonella sp.]|nr:TolC family protein [Ideonella sp.]MCC7456491.1 TolC family protein [Nitrospira sp.]
MPVASTIARVAASAALLAFGPAHAGLSLHEAMRLAQQRSPALAAQHSAVDGAQAMQVAAGTLPDPRLTVGVDNLPLRGADRYTLTRDSMTMQRIGLMQEVPNRAKRAARVASAQARAERERTLLAVAQLAVQRDAALAWLAVLFAERRVDQLGELERENRLLQDTLDARIAAGRALPAERTAARQDALALADRRDDAQRDVAKARAALRRWVGERADDTLDGAVDDAFNGNAALAAVAPEQARADLHHHAELAAYSAQQAIAQAEAREADAEQRGDWAWEVSYNRRGAQYGDMVSFQLSFDLPWQRSQRQQPQLRAREHEVQRAEAERDDALRRHREELEAQLAELQALERQRTRLAGTGQALASEHVALALAAYEAGRGDLGAVLAARREAADTRLRLIDLDAQRSALRVRLNTLVEQP